MPPGDYFFYAALFFLGGVGGASLGLNAWILAFNAALMAALLVLWIWKKERKFLVLAAFSLLVAAGAVYCRASAAGLETLSVPFGAETSFIGIVDGKPEASGGSLDAVVKSDYLGGARILLKLPRYPEYFYGDEIRVIGRIKRPAPESYANYLIKERIVGTMSFPEAEIVASGRGSPIMAALYGFKNSIVGAFQKMFSPEEAALAAGLTLGERGGFSASFEQAMRSSGTTHLVALSGYNITVIVVAAMGLLLFFLRRRLAVALTVILIIAFVLMTGAEASVVRAAVMGFLLLLARETGRLFDVRNAIVLAGLAMIILNPQVLVFDVGFELSFLALIGLVYLEPALKSLFRFAGKKGFLSWRENLFTTASAQMMVLPILVGSFGGFSPISLVSNVLVLGLVPLTMGLSFVAAGLSFISSFLGSAAGLFAWPLLKFEVGVIKFFGAWPLPALPAPGWTVAVAYYAAVAGFIVWRDKKHAVLETH